MLQVQLLHIFNFIFINFLIYAIENTCDLIVNLIILFSILKFKTLPRRLVFSRLTTLESHNESEFKSKQLRFPSRVNKRCTNSAPRTNSRTNRGKIAIRDEDLRIIPRPFVQSRKDVRMADRRFASRSGAV